MKQIPSRVIAPQPLTLLSVMIVVAVAALIASVSPDVGQALTAVGRKPAHADRGAVKMDVMHVPCWDRPVAGPHQVSARWVRLTGAACVGKTGNADAITIRNLSNGFVATVFATGKTLTTDYIPLKEGANDVVIAFERGAGVSTETRLRLDR